MTILGIIQQATDLAIDGNIDDLNKLIQSSAGRFIPNKQAALNTILTNISKLTDKIAELETDLEAADELATVDNIENPFDVYYDDELEEMEEIELFDVKTED